MPKSTPIRAHFDRVVHGPILRRTSFVSSLWIISDRKPLKYEDKEECATRGVAEETRIRVLEANVPPRDARIVLQTRIERIYTCMSGTVVDTYR